MLLGRTRAVAALSRRHLATSRSSTSQLEWRRVPTTAEPGCGAIWSAEVPKLWKRDANISPADDRGAHIVLAEQLFPPEVMREARRLITTTLEFDRDADSVDNSPTFELTWVREGRCRHAELGRLFLPSVEERLVPLLRSSALRPCGGPLVLCEALVRSYDEGQRRVHPAHFDADALVTAVVEVDTSPEGADASPGGGADGSTEGAARPEGRGFEGQGFYVQPGAHVTSRLPVVMAPGDVVAHSFDLQVTRSTGSALNPNP